MSDKGIEELRALNDRLAKLLDDPQEGLASWKIMLSGTLMEMADYAGLGVVSKWGGIIAAVRRMMICELSNRDQFATYWAEAKRLLAESSKGETTGR